MCVSIYIYIYISVSNHHDVKLFYEELYSRQIITIRLLAFVAICQFYSATATSQ